MINVADTLYVTAAGNVFAMIQKGVETNVGGTLFGTTDGGGINSYGAIFAVTP